MILDFGSIAEHTCRRCGGTGQNGGGEMSPKDFPVRSVFHLDKYAECSVLAVAVSS